MERGYVVGLAVSPLGLWVGGGIWRWKMWDRGLWGVEGPEITGLV